MSSHILTPPGRVKPQQIRNYWVNQAWAKYKAVREMQEHTGGGDGDADRAVDSGEDTDEDDNDEDEGEIVVGGKRKRRKMTRFGYSMETLREFQQSKIFDMIDIRKNGNWKL